MAKWVGLASVIGICIYTAAVYWTGKQDAWREAELANTKADQAQADEAREIKNAVEKLDDTGLRDAYDKLRRDRENLRR